jgi:glyoxylase-like metal-dependent hydrolase (beta-lactamase superfamily II)
MEIIRKVFGELSNNVYIIYDTDTLEGYVIDPGYEAKKLADIIRKRRLNIKGIILTHYHYDHADACSELSKLAGGLDVYIHAYDAKHLKGHYDHKIKEGDTFNFGSESLEVIHTPGHSPGSICLIDKRSKNAFTGDTIFPTDTGYVIFEGGEPLKMMHSMQKLDPILTDDYMIWPGHEDNVSMSYVRQHNKEYKLYLQGLIPEQWPPAGK